MKMMKIRNIFGQYWLIILLCLSLIASLISFPFSYIAGVICSILFAISIGYILYYMYTEEIELRNKLFIFFKGWHFTLHLPRFFILQKADTFTVNQTFKFTDSCFYKFNTPDDFDINKLFGLNVGMTFQPHQNSFRFGWNCQDDNGKITIFKYEYINGIRQYKKLYEVLPNIMFEYQIQKTDKHIIYTIYDEDGEILIKEISPYVMQKDYDFGNYCYPYFGGTNPAPHTIYLYS